MNSLTKFGVGAAAAALTLGFSGVALAQQATTTVATTTPIIAPTAPVPTPTPVIAPAPVSDPTAGPAAAGSTLETHINNNGTVLVRGAKITGINGATISTTQSWGAYSINWVINTTGSTQFLLRYGGKATAANFSVGDYISFSGPLDNTQATATVHATVVKDFSSQRAASSFSGTVESVNTANTSFTLSTASRGTITVVTSPSTMIKQGTATTTFATLSVGQKVTRTDGVWDNLSKTLQAQSVVIYQNMALLDKRTFAGTLGTLAGTSAPTTFTFASGSTTYTVNVADNTSLLSNGRNPIQLSQLTSGDTIRIYGAVEANNTSTIDAYVVRDTKVK